VPFFRHLEFQRESAIHPNFLSYISFIHSRFKQTESPILLPYSRQPLHTFAIKTIWDTLVCAIGFLLAQQNLLTQPHSPRFPLALRSHQRALHPLRNPILHLRHSPRLAKQPKAPLLPHRLPPPLGCRSLHCRLRPA
jgi:hypothetical protein